MNSFRNNPDSEANEAMTKANERDVFAAQMQAKAERRCLRCGGLLDEFLECYTCLPNEP